MTKRLLMLTTAVGLILGTAAIAQNTEPSKTDANKPAAQQTDKNAKPMSRIEKWQADKQTEAAEKPVDKNTGAAPGNTAQSNAPAKPATNAQTPTAAPAATTNAQSQTPASNTGTSAQSQAPASGAAPTTNAQTPNAAQKTAPAQAQTNTPTNNPTPQAQTNQTQTNPTQTNTATPQAQPNAAPAPAQAQTPNAAPATNQQAQQPPNANTTSNTSSSAQTTISAGVSVTDPQRARISESVAKLKVEPLKNVSFSVSVGTVVPRDVRLQPVPAEVVEIVPQYRDYRFFTVREEIVIVEPSTMKIVTVLPRNGGSTASTTTSTQTSSTTTESRSKFSDRDRATIKKHASQPRRERTTTTTTERDDPRSARAESRRELRIGDRLPDSVELHDMPERAYRDAPALRDYRYMQRGSRTYVIEPRERTIIEEVD